MLDSTKAEVEHLCVRIGGQADKMCMCVYAQHLCVAIHTKTICTHTNCAQKGLFARAGLHTFVEGDSFECLCKCISECTHWGWAVRERHSGRRRRFPL